MTLLSKYKYNYKNIRYIKFQMINKIILASKSRVRKKILDQHGINCEVIPANIDEDLVKESLINEKATPKIISKKLYINLK